MLWNVAAIAVPQGVSEYSYAGGLSNRPVEVIKGVTTDLPIPATAEIALEGEIVPPEVETRIEGPFGERSGYYAAGARPESAFRVKSVLHRNNPVILGAPPSRFNSLFSFGAAMRRAATTWDELDRNIPGVRGVSMVEGAGGRSIAVVSLEQKYAGHAKQAAMLVLGSTSTAYDLQFVIVVDEDIDPTDISEVLWAMGTRCEPEADIDIIRNCWSTSLNPRVEPEKKKQGNLAHSTGVILACKPYSWIKDFPPAIKTTPELLKKTKEKWAKYFI